MYRPWGPWWPVLRASQSSRVDLEDPDPSFSCKSEAIRVDDGLHLKQTLLGTCVEEPVLCVSSEACGRAGLPRLGAETLQELMSSGEVLRPLIVAMGTRGDVARWL